MLRFFFRLCVAFVLLGSAGCRSTIDGQNTSLLPGLDVASQNVNTYIKLTDPPVLANSHRNNDILTLQLTNLSDTEIVFPDNYSIHLLAKTHESWSDVQNNFFNAGGSFNLPTNKSSPGGLVISVLPYIPGLAAPIQIRIIVVGNIENTSGARVAAYIDVTLEP